MYDWNAACWPALSTSPVVESQTTAWYWARFAVVNWAASSVAVTEKPFCGAELLDRGDAVRDGECRKPAVFENTRTLVRGAADAGIVGAAMRTRTRADKIVVRRRSMALSPLRDERG